jgi:hypothetical protein
MEVHIVNEMITVLMPHISHDEVWSSFVGFLGYGGDHDAPLARICNLRHPCQCAQSH